jgi:hypothetical protein
MTTIPLSLDETRVDFLSEIACPDCGSFLALHSPDIEMPERMLATCDDCKAWYLMDLAGGTLTSLPVDEIYDDE